MSIAERECPTTIKGGTLKKVSHCLYPKGEALKKVKEGKSKGKTIIKIIEE